MYCAYHPTKPARAQCAHCSRALCVACDHRIKGFPYCQDCIVLGIESLSRSYPHAPRPSSGKAVLAALCGVVIPGLGAVYNRQNVKAVVHFITIVGLFQLSGVMLFKALFALAGLGFYFYSIIDAYRTAQQIAQGETPAANEENFKRALARRAPMIGLGLILAGLIAIIQVAKPLGFSLSLPGLVPVALLLLGGYLVTRYFKRSRERVYESESARKLPYSLIPGNGEHQSEDFRNYSRRQDYR